MKSLPLLCIAIILSLALTGCIAIPFSSNVPDELPNFKSQIISGKTPKNEVREMLGDPLIKHEDNNVEVYRALTGNDWVWAGFFLMPLILEKYDVIAYAMVAYDQNDIVSDLDWGLFGTKSLSYEDRPVNITDHLTLEVGGLVFISKRCSPSLNIWHQLKACEYLYLNHVSSEVSLNNYFPKDHCLLTVDTGEFVNQIYIDNQTFLDLDHFGLNGEFIQLELSSGEHTITMDVGGYVSPYKQAMKRFKCNSEQQLFIYPIVHEDQNFWKWDGHKIEIVIDNRPSEIFQNHRKLLFYEGQWVNE